MKPAKEKVLSEIKESAKIALCIDYIDTIEKAYTIAALNKFLTSEGKEVSLILSEKSVGQFATFLSEQKIQYSTEAKPLSYVISLDYGQSGLEKVTYDTDEEKGVLKFYIVPTKGAFDFENVEYSTEGKSYDLTITVGIKSFKDMGEVYEKSGYLFKESKVISIIKDVSSLGDLYWKSEEGESLLLAMYRLIKDKAGQEVKNLVAEGVIATNSLLEGGTDSSLWNSLSMLSTDGADIDQAIRKSYFSKSYSNLDLQIKLMHNVKVAKDAGVIWSTLTHEDLKFCGITEELLNIKGRITFNISKEFDLAIAAYEVSKDKVSVVIESNNPAKYSALKIAALFNGKGTEYHANFTVTDMPIRDFSKRFFIVLSDLYDAKVEGESVGFKSTSN